MRGFPPLHVIAFVVAFGLLAIPLSRLTFARLDETPLEFVKAPVQEETTGVPTRIRLRLAHLPTTLSLRAPGGAELLSQDQQKPKELEAALEVTLAIPKEGLELIATATWPEDTPDTVLTTEVEPDGLETKSVTHWSLGAELAAAYFFDWED